MDSCETDIGNPAGSRRSLARTRGDRISLYAGAQRAELTASLCKAAVNSRSWVVFIAAVTFVDAAFSLFAGIYMLIVGASHHLPPVVAWGLFNLIGGLDFMAGGFLLTAYANRVASLQYSAHAVVLEKALDALRNFWIFVAINLIVMLTFVIFVVVWAISISGSIPW